MYDDYDDEEAIEQEAQEQASESIADQFNETLKFEIPVQADLNRYIQQAVQQSVARAVDNTIKKLVDDKLKQRIEKELGLAIAAVASEAFTMPIKEFDYAGNVKSERSLEDLVREKLLEVQKQGLNYKIQTGSYSSDNKTIADTIKTDIYTAIKANLRPQFEAMEKEFKDKSQAALREFAVQAVDSATHKVLGGGR